MWVAPAYAAKLRGNLDLLGFLSVLFSHSVAGKVEGREVVTVDAPRPALASETGVDAQTVKRFEKRLAALGVVRQLAHNSRSRVLEILPPPAVPMRAVKKDMGVTRDPQVADQTGGTVCGKPGGKLWKTQTGRGSCVTPNGGHRRPPNQFLSPLKTESRKVYAHACARATDQASSSGGGEAAEAARRLTSLAAAKIAEVRAGGRSCRVLGRRKQPVVQELLEARWHAYGEPETATRSLERDFERLLAYALGSEVKSPAAYLVRALERGAWRAEPAPESQAAAVRAAGAQAERPVEDLASREGRIRDCLDDGLERFERALSRLKRQPHALASIVTRWQTIHPQSPAEANRLAVSIESFLLTLPE